MPEAMSEPLPAEPMTRDAFYAWAERQPRGRYELHDGRVVAMAPERARHAEAKLLATIALREAIAAAGLDCQAYVDGLAVQVGERTAYEPDALVNCGPKPDPDSVVAPNPVVVVEVTSPSTARTDSTGKLVDYFRVPGIQHYLILDPSRRVLVHHRRTGEGTLATAILGGGTLVLDPPGLTLQVEALFPPA
jgi:Uma2 family endonuclease